VALPGPLAPSDCFRVVPPRSREVAVIVEAPHPGLLIDAECLSTLHVAARALARDADLFVDLLVEEAADQGATLLIAQVSRYFVDLNRAATEHDAISVEGSHGHEAPHGVIWHRSTDGDRVLRFPLARAELERRLAVAHRPYHDALAALIAEKQRKFGEVVLVCAHSMPSVGHGFGGREVLRADIVPGTRGRTTAAAAVIDTVEHQARAMGYSVRHDDPYRGGYSTLHYGAPSRGVHAVQIEVARRLYMNESNLRRAEEGVARLRLFYKQLVALLGALDLRSTRTT
jgi:N-formylglutamate deformylase